MTEPSADFVSIAAQFATLVDQDHRDRGVPVMIHVDLTYRCDLDCEHCYLDRKSDWPELRTEEFYDLIDQAADLGVLRMTWSGGEPFARPDFEEIIEYSSRRGMVNRIKTHAGNVTPERAAWLASQSVDRVEVSVYSLSETVHDAVTRIPGSLRATLAGIAAMRRAGVSVTVAWVATRGAVDEGLDLHRYFEALGCKISFGVGIQPDNGGTQNTEALDLGDRELVRAYVALQHQRQLLQGTNAPVLQLDPNGAPCSAGRTVIYVAPDGGVTPCVMFPMQIGHLREQSLADIWFESEKRKELAAWTNADRSDCLSCGAGGNCFYCPGEAFKRTGDYRSAPDEFHQRTRAKMQSFQQVYGTELDDSFWQSIPETTQQERKRKAHFPIYRPQKGRRTA